MFPRPSANSWRDVAFAMTPTRVLPGAHDLLATDATNNAVGRRTSLPLQTVLTDLAVGTTDFHISKEQDNELCAY